MASLTVVVAFMSKPMSKSHTSGGVLLTELLVVSTTEYNEIGTNEKAMIGEEEPLLNRNFLSKKLGRLPQI